MPKAKVKEEKSELKKYKILGEIFPTDEEGTLQETALEVGSVQEVPESVGTVWVEAGLAELVEEEAPAKKEKKAEFPEVSGNGKFQVVQHGKGFLVYNPTGSRVSDVLSDAEAKDIVLRQNSAGGLK